MNAPGHLLEMPVNQWDLQRKISTKDTVAYSASGYAFDFRAGLQRAQLSEL